MARRSRPAAPPPPPAPPQIELFPEVVQVEALDARRLGGERTRVRGVWRVRYESERRPHRVWHDRHGWYCEEHGPRCRAVSAVRPED